MGSLKVPAWETTKDQSRKSWEAERCELHKNPLEATPGK